MPHISAVAVKNAPKFETAKGHYGQRQKEGERVMTFVTSHVAEQTSRFNGTMVGIFTAAVTVLAGVLTFATFVNI